MRVAVDSSLRVGYADQPEQLECTLPGRLLGDVLVRVDRLDELRAHLVERMQRGQRVLEDHRDFPAPHAAELLVR